MSVDRRRAELAADFEPVGPGGLNGYQRAWRLTHLAQRSWTEFVAARWRAAITPRRAP